MGTILIAMPKRENADRIADMIRRSGMGFEVEICNTGAELLRVANDRDYGAIICTKTLRDMSCVDLAEYMPDFFGLVVITSDPSLEFYSERCVKLLSPFTVADLCSTIEMVAEGFYRKRKEYKAKPAKRDPREVKIIDSAKALLMERNGMSEPEAFRYLQKNSMDLGRSLVETAEMILAMNP